MNRLWRWLAGDDGTARRAPPAGELLHPVALAALALLAINDWVLKPSAAPGWLTGKLSDVAGLACFPLVVTAVVDTALWLAARAGAPWDFTLRRWKIAAAIGGAAALFAAIKLSPDAARAVAAALAAVFGRAAIVPDATDLVALPALGVAWWLARQELRRVPLGRVELALRRARRGRPVTGALGDAIAAGAPPADVDALDAALAAWTRGGPAAPVDAALARLRGRGSPDTRSTAVGDRPPAMNAGPACTETAARGRAAQSGRSAGSSSAGGADSCVEVDGDEDDDAAVPGGTST